MPIVAEYTNFQGVIKKNWSAESELGNVHLFKETLLSVKPDWIGKKSQDTQNTWSGRELYFCEAMLITRFMIYNFEVTKSSLTAESV